MTDRSNFTRNDGYWAALLALIAPGCADSDQSAPVTLVSADVANQFVEAHNAVRSAVSEPPGYPGTWVALPEVTWSDTVARSAQAWANHLRDASNCGLEHENNTGYGENLAMGSNLTPAGALTMWASEAQNYTYNPVYAWDSETGHYTQIVWRASTEIGCGMASCGRTVVISCRYSPPGNYLGKQPY
jgi:pathogenesis-related protein 1